MENLEAKFAGLLSWERRKRREQTLAQRQLLRGGAGDHFIALRHLSAQSLAALARPRGVIFLAGAVVSPPRALAARRFGAGFGQTGQNARPRGTRRHRLGIVDAQGNSGRGAAGFAPSRRKAPLRSSRARFRRAAGVGRPTPPCLCWRSGSCFCGSISTAAMNRRAMAGRRRWRTGSANIPASCKKKQKMKDCARRSIWAESLKKPRKKISRQKAPTNR